MDIETILNRHKALKAVKTGYWSDLWRDVRKYVYPNYDFDRSEGGQRGTDIYDTTAEQARQRLASGIYQWMAPPDKRWFELTADDDELAKKESVRTYFSAVTAKIMQGLANSNWSANLIMVLNELACGLDGIIYTEDGGAEAPFNFRCFPIEQVCYAENSKGTIDTVFREYEETARNLVNEFGEENVGEEVRAKANDPKQMDTKFTVVHAVFPREERDPKKQDKPNKAYADYYILSKPKIVMREGGYDEFPFAICRFEKCVNESYGRGPGVNMLPDIKMLNRERQAYKLILEHMADPGWLIPDGSVVDTKKFDKSPGKLHIYRAGARGEKPEPVMLRNDIGHLREDIEAERKSIQEGFFWDIFDPLGELRNMTATEAEIREGGKLVPFAPIAGNLHSELFSRVIQRCYAILSRRMELPEMPMELTENPNFKTVFVSKIALAIRKIEVLGWLQTEQSLTGLAAVKPDLFDNFNIDEIARDIAESNGAPPKWFKSKNEVDQARAARAEAQQQQQAQQMLMEGGKNLPAFGKAPESGSPLSLMMKGQGV